VQLVPWRIVLNPDRHRWAICTQVCDRHVTAPLRPRLRKVDRACPHLCACPLLLACACFKEVCFRRDLLAAFFGAGKVLPVKRGAGVDQPMLLDLGRRLAANRWAHVFPQGRVIQDSSPRNHYRLREGQLESGANAAAVPAVVPAVVPAPAAAASGAPSLAPPRASLPHIAGKTPQPPREPSPATASAPLLFHPQPAFAEAGHRHRLKWGVGKLVAHAPRASNAREGGKGGVAVVVLAFRGMEELLPLAPDGFNLAPLDLKRLFKLDKLGRDAETLLGVGGNGGGAAVFRSRVGQCARSDGCECGVHVAVGRPLAFDDLIAAHEEQHGRLWTYGAAPGLDAVLNGGDQRGWSPSSGAERELYGAITARIDEELRRLEGLLWEE